MLQFLQRNIFKVNIGLCAELALNNEVGSSNVKTGHGMCKYLQEFWSKTSINKEI